MKAEDFLDEVYKSSKEDYGILPPPTKAEDALRVLKDHLLVEDWYVVNPISQEQVYTELVVDILNKTQPKNWFQRLFNL